MTDDLFDDLEGEDITDYKPMDVNEVKAQLPTYTSEKLCEMIVCDRYLGGYRELGIACMEELAKRRTEGSDFNFEEHISKSMNDLPALNFNSMPDIRDVLRQFVGKGGIR